MTRFMRVEDLLGAKAASALSPALVNNNSEAAAKARELKRQLGNLVRMLVEEDECRLGLFDHISNTLASLRALQFPHTPDPSPAAAGVKADAGVAVPEQFLCPISAELMTDPVVLSSGETYDRAYIEAWLRAGNRTCPKTQQVLQHTMLLPNHLVRHMIDHWCAANGLPQAQLQQQQRNNNNNSSAAAPEAQAMTQEERAYAALLLRRLDTGKAEGVREAARELRSLTKTRSAYRAYVGAQPSAVAALAEVAAGAGEGADTDAEAQEHAVTALLNVSIHGACKEWMLAQEQVLLPRLTDALRAPGGTRACRSNAAAALFSLSTATADRGDPKELIGRTPGAVLGLVDLLRGGGGGGERDAAQALFSLCARSENRARCVAAGGVEAVVGLLRAGVLAEESVALLALLCPPLQEAAIRACAGGALPLVLRLIADGHGHGYGHGGGGDGAKAVENAVVVLHSAPAEPLREAVAGDDEALPALLQLSACGTPRARRKASAVLRRLHHTV